MRLRPLVWSTATFGAQQPTGRTAWVGCTASANITERVHQGLISLDEGLLFDHVELLRHRLRLAVLHPQTMKQRNQPRAALINDAELLLDPRPDMARRAR